VKNNIISLKPFIDRMTNEEQNRQAYLAEMEELRQVELEQEEIWRQQRAIHGFPGEDDIPVDDGYRFFDPDDPEHIMAAFDALIERQKAEHVEAVEALGVIKDFLERFSPHDDAAPEPELEIRDPHPDEPLTLFEVVCLPELGGQLYVGMDIPGKPGRTAVKTLRAEIAAGRLKRVPPFNKNIYVSRRTIKEWTEWRDDGSLPISSGSSPNTPRTGGSARTATGRSQMARSELAQASALSFVQTLRKPGSTTK
jgi:hypothetical protein